MSENDTCQECSNKIGFGDGVHLTDMEGPGRLLCLECFNSFVSDQAGLGFEHPRFLPLAIDDCEGNPHTFEFRTMLSGDVVTLRAIEPLDNGKQGYEFLVVGDPEDDPMHLFRRLYDSMTRELSRKYLVESDLGPQIGDADEVRAQVSWDSERDGRVPLLVIDGREISWDELGRMLMTYEGFKFKLEIFETDDEQP
ncbi:MAG: hypothetical protein V2I67_09470 [Thermoanaerobaculales bacterium]|jgi:hypothetical protein|nr:hypothetical protein [Thermoanaerobaculales bacterium]